MNISRTGSMWLIFIYPVSSMEPESEKVHVMVGERGGQWPECNDGLSRVT